MPQLVMRWKNDGKAPRPLCLPEGVEQKNILDFPNGVEVWCKVARCLQPEGYPDHTDEALYEAALNSRANYRPEHCRILTVNGEPAATISVLCDNEKKDAYIHMVACRPEFRGKGLGHLLNEVAEELLKKAGMQTAWLTTDDWRLAAIKTYLKAGYEPDPTSVPDAKERWEKILAQLG